jgi:hypothetical protein
MTDSLYATLPSNASLNVYPENVGARFKVKLPKPLKMEASEGWEVGLVDIQFKCSWTNLRNPFSRSSKRGYSW